MGKNFSANNLGQRKKSDFYETPISMTEQMLDRVSLTNEVLEPARGAGAIENVVRARGFEVTAYDKETDFLKESRNFQNVVTNPPFSLAYEFINKSKSVATKKIVMLLPLSYLHGKKRFDDIWSDRIFPLSEIYVFTRYPLLGEDLRPDGKYKTGMMVYAWFVWDKDHVGEPVIRWIDNNHFILNKNDVY